MQNYYRNLTRSVATIAALWALLNVVTLVGQEKDQKVYDSPKSAVADLVAAVRTDDINRLVQIFGPDAKEIVSSGDKVADERARERFIKKYDEMNRLVRDKDGVVTLYIGAENWPFPVPLIDNHGAWQFDSVKGEKEILYRRIGHNEFDTIDTLQALVDAQKDYAGQLHDGASVKHYADKIMSSEGKHDGLYWKAESGEPTSPIGPLMAQATAEGYKKQAGPTPFHGYIYRILSKQGAAARGGAMDYMENGQLVKGFAIVAYPAEYRNSGVMTFLVNQNGTVYQKDLGPKTESIASSMTEYNPDRTWKVAETASD
jgi:hypothetical protein